MPASNLRLKSALDWFTRLDGINPFESLSSAFLHDLGKNPEYAVALAIRTVLTPYFEQYDDQLRELVLGLVEAECAQAHAFSVGDEFTPFFVHAQVMHQGDLPEYADVPNLLAQLSRVLGVPMEALRSDGEIYSALDIGKPDDAWEVMKSFAWPLGEQASVVFAEAKNPNTAAKTPGGAFEVTEVLIRCLVHAKHEAFLYEAFFDGLNTFPADDRPEHVRWQEGIQVTPCSVFQGPLEALMALNFVHPCSVLAHQVATATAHLATSDGPAVIFTVDLATSPVIFEDEELGMAFAMNTQRALADLNDQMEAAQSEDVETLENLAEVRQSVVDSAINLRITANAFHADKRFSRYEIDLPAVPAVGCAALGIRSAQSEGALTLLSADTRADRARAVIEDILAGEDDGEGAAE